MSAAPIEAEEERLSVHRQMLGKKRMLQQVFREFHDVFRRLDEDHFGNTAGMRVELGAGVAPVRETYPDVLATDIVPVDGFDGVVDAQNMPFAPASVRAIYGQNCFHHFPDPDGFFTECTRVLSPGGGVILIEPYHGAIASLVYPRLFDTEGFDKRMDGWRAPVDGPMNGANQALSYIVFRRDRALFEQRHPELEPVHAAPLHNYMRYVLSGGLNFPQLAPDVFIPVIRAMELAARPLAQVLALHHVIVLRRRAD